MKISASFDGTDDLLSQRLQARSDSLTTALEARMTVLGEKLKERIVQKVSGEVLQRESGELADSFRVDPPVVDDTGVSVSVSTDVPYARLHEYGGGSTDIVPTTKKALHFLLTGGKEQFATHVKPVPERPFMRPALEEMKNEIEFELREVLMQDLGADILNRAGSLGSE